jgi:hypothetical protein
VGGITERLFDLLFGKISVALTYREREELDTEILSAFVKMNTSDAMEFLAEHLRKAPSDSKWKKVIATAASSGGAASFHFLSEQLQTIIEDKNAPSDRKVEMIHALHQIALRVEDENTTELSLLLCQHLQSYLTIIHGNEKLIEAVVFLLFRCAPGNTQKTALLGLATNGGRLDIAKEVARYLLNQEHPKQIGNFRNYYVRNRHSDILLYQLVVQLLPREELRSLLCADLANPEQTICSAALDVVSLAITRLDLLTTPNDEIIQRIRILLDSPHTEVVRKAIALSGELDKDVEVIDDLYPFLRGPESDLAFGALLDLAERNSWLDNASFMEGQHDENDR